MPMKIVIIGRPTFRTKARLVAGNMDWNSGNTDNTNWAMLVDASVSVLGPLAVNPRCSIVRPTIPW